MNLVKHTGCEWCSANTLTADCGVFVCVCLHSLAAESSLLSSNVCLCKLVISVLWDRFPWNKSVPCGEGTHPANVKRSALAHF